MLAVAPVYATPSLGLGSTASYRVTGKLQTSQSCTSDPVIYAGQACSGTVVGIPTVFVTILDDGACSPSGDPNCSFNPNFVSVSQGGSVVWTISGALQHDVKSNKTANVGLPSFSGNITAGGMVRVTFDVPGVYQYFDLNYNWMKGTILVNPVSPLPPPTATSSQVDLSGSIA